MWHRHFSKTVLSWEQNDSKTSHDQESLIILKRHVLFIPYSVQNQTMCSSTNNSLTVRHGGGGGMTNLGHTTGQ